jgi:hypothetical protein
MTRKELLLRGQEKKKLQPKKPQRLWEDWE